MLGQPKLLIVHCASDPPDLRWVMLVLLVCTLLHNSKYSVSHAAKCRYAYTNVVHSLRYIFYNISQALLIEILLPILSFPIFFFMLSHFFSIYP